MKTIYTFNVTPRLPENLQGLLELAHNLCWSWDAEILALFRRLDASLWEEVYHNPVLMLGKIPQERLVEASRDQAFLSHFQRAYNGYKQYMDSQLWFQKTNLDVPKDFVVAYFSMEFGLTECLQNYSGGLGVLAGDHLKSASDVGLPLVGIGILYQTGYFRQYLNPDGWQQESNPVNDFQNLPIQLVTDKQQQPITIEVEMLGHPVIAQIWEAKVGRISLYLLDTNIPTNRPEDQDITNQLYGGNEETRIRQEILMGIGGIRALKALGKDPMVCHMNEGHAAFLGLERIRELMTEHQVDFHTARQAAMAGNVFTTHTPVPAGIDIFVPELVEKYFSRYRESLGLTKEAFMALGRRNPSDQSEPFNMATLAFSVSNMANGVSRLHGDVSRKMWQSAWPGVPENEIPISSVTNGTHAQSWTSSEMRTLLNRYLGPQWEEDTCEQNIWDQIDDIPDEELFRTHERRRERLVAFTRRRLEEQLIRRGALPSEIRGAREVLNPSALTIGFARRFATYKRASLILRDPERLLRLLTNADRPLQFIFAGKAHPHDNGGKELIRQLVHFCRQAQVRPRVVFLEDYDMSVARYLVQGVDVWMNTPRRPMEASGTSGMKVCFNGGLNMSILDGWWCEAYDTTNGWAIGAGEDYTDNNYQDEVESKALYNLLEQEVVPLFYERGSDGLPRGWIARMKASMKTCCPVYNTCRMVREYTQRFYVPAANNAKKMAARKLAKAKALAEWKTKVRNEWQKIRVEEITSEASPELCVCDSFKVKAVVQLGSLSPTDVNVQLYTGLVDHDRQVTDGSVINMQHKSAASTSGTHVFEGAITCTSSGQYGFAVRVTPNHEDMVSPFEIRRIVWG